MNILLVDDSMLVKNMLKSLFSSLDGYEIIGEASNGKSAIEKVSLLQPDLIIMDINMPEMDGITATGIIMEKNPLPIIIFTSEDIAEVGYKALNMGALEVIPKPNINQIGDPQFINEFKGIIDNVTRFGKSKIIKERGIKSTLSPSTTLKEKKDFRIVVLGASTGGPSAVKTVLSDIPSDFPLPILITQHIEIGFDGGYAEWLNKSSPLTVKIAQPREQVKAGTVYVAPATHHLVCHEDYLLCDDGPRVDNQKPSVDKMFYSAVSAYGAKVLGILLTGMGRDGARGCLKIVQSGGETLVQDKESSMIFGMPKTAIELKGATEVLPLSGIAQTLINRVMT